MNKLSYTIALALTYFNLTQLLANGNETIESYQEAKAHLYEVFKTTGGKTLYCDCRHRNRVIDATSCGYIPVTNNERARRTEVEHMVPASAFGHSFKEWLHSEQFPQCSRTHGKRKRGRDCARTNPEFRRMEADMYNLWLTIGELNAHRANYPINTIPGEVRNYGSCDFEVWDQQVEPRPEARGIMARAYLYMDSSYPGRGIIPNERFRKLLKEWSKEFPVNATERQWAEEILRIQGNCNPFVLTCSLSSTQLFP